MSRSRSVAIWATVIGILAFLAVTEGQGELNPVLELLEMCAAPNVQHTQAIDTRITEQRVLASAELDSRSAAGSSGITVTLAASLTTTSWDNGDPARERFDLPLLLLRREREAAPVNQRTLKLMLANLGAGSEIMLEAVSMHTNPTTDSPHIMSRRFVPSRTCTVDDPCPVHWVLDPERTPSDLYTLRVQDETGHTWWEGQDRPAFAALDTWDVALGGYVVRITYATLFRFALGWSDLENRLPPQAVADFIEQVFVPLVTETWHTQVEEWGFGQSLHPDWDADSVIEIVITDPPHALFDGIGTYTALHGPDGPFHATRRIWWSATNKLFHGYDTLEDAYKAWFTHEFFHLMQWNVLLSPGQTSPGQTFAGRRTARDPQLYWRTWLEGQANVVPAIQYPELVHSVYYRVANGFLFNRLNSSYNELEADQMKWYAGALYWRFLYEQYGDTTIIRAALQEMAYGYEPDIVVGTPRVMDRALQRVDGPFRTFEESLVAFARANYALRLENGRCADADFAACGGRYYDPEHRYIDPPLEAELTYDGAPLTYAGAVPTSFGMDFIEIRLDPAQPLAVRFQGEGKVSGFSVQVWELGSGESKPRALTLQPKTLSQDKDGAYAYAIPQSDRTKCDRLALIVTRLDADEALDPEGRYRITLTSAVEMADGGEGEATLMGDGSIAQ